MVQFLNLDRCKTPKNGHFPLNMNHTEFDFFYDFTLPIFLFLKDLGIETRAIYCSSYYKNITFPIIPSYLFEKPSKNDEKE